MGHCQVVLQKPERRGLELALVGGQTYSRRNRVLELLDGSRQAVLYRNRLGAAARAQAPLGGCAGVGLEHQLQLQRRALGHLRRPCLSRHQARRRVDARLLRGGTFAVVACRST